MPSQKQQLILELKALVAKYNADITAAASKTEKFQKKTSKAFVKVQKDSKKTGDSLFKFSNVAKGVFAALSIGAFTNFADEIQIANNQLKNVTATTEEYNEVSRELNRLAIETRQNVSELTSVYARFKRAGEEANFTQQETLDLTESLTKAFKIEGNTTAEVNSVLLQLTQSFRSGRIAGEEFRAVSEGSTLVLQALAKQMGVNVGELKELAAQGEVTPRILIDGLKRIQPEINKQFKGLAPTFAEVGAVWGTVAADAYRDSFVENTAIFIKTFAIDAAKGFAVIFSSPEGENEIIEEITKVALALSELQDSNFSFVFGPQIDILRRKLASLREDLVQAKIESESVPLEVSISGGIEDPRIQQERDFLVAIADLHAENVTTIEERFMFDIAANKAALDEKLINIRQFHKQQEAIAMGFASDQEALDKVKQKNANQNAKIDQKHARQAMQLAALVFEDNKAISSGIAFVNTAQGVTKALAIQDYAGATLTALIGAAQIASINSASKGGGSPSVGGGSVGGGQPSAQSEPSTEISTSVADVTGGEVAIQKIQIIISDESGNNFIDTLATKTDEARSDGRV